MSVTVLSTQVVGKPRVAWRCDGCHRTFAAGGVPKNQQSCVNYGRAYTIKWCPTCEAMAKDLVAVDRSALWDDGITDEHLDEWMRDNYGTWEAADKHFAKEAESR